MPEKVGTPDFVLEDEDTESPSSGGVVLIARSEGKPVDAPIEVFVSGHPVWPYPLSDPVHLSKLPPGMTLEGGAMLSLDRFSIFRGKNGRCFLPRQGREQCSVCVLVEGHEFLVRQQLALAPSGEAPAVVHVDLEKLRGGGIVGRVTTENGSLAPNVTVVWTAQGIFGEERLWSRPGTQFSSPGNQLAGNLRIRRHPDVNGDFFLAPCLPSQDGRLYVFQGDLLVHSVTGVSTRYGEKTVVEPIVLNNFRTVRIRVSAPGHEFPNFLIFAEGCPSHFKSKANPVTHGTVVSHGRGEAIVPFLPGNQAKMTPMVDYLSGPRVLRSDRDGRARAFVLDAVELTNKMLATAAKAVERGELFLETENLMLSQQKIVEVLQNESTASLLKSLRNALAENPRVDGSLIDGVRQAVEWNRPWKLLQVLLGP